jgi:hypothetical protein
MIALAADRGCFLLRCSAYIPALRQTLLFRYLETLVNFFQKKEDTFVVRSRREEKIMADKYQVPLFFTIPGIRMRLVLIGEQEVNGHCVAHDRTELTQFSPLDADAVHRMMERVRE